MQALFIYFFASCVQLHFVTFRLPPSPNPHTHLFFFLFFFKSCHFQQKCNLGKQKHQKKITGREGELFKAVMFDLEKNAYESSLN